jgi:hypothetical protein
MVIQFNAETDDQKYTLYIVLLMILTADRSSKIISLLDCLIDTGYNLSLK